METENETSIVKHLGQIGALDWIDKYYTTSNDNDTLLLIPDNLVSSISIHIY